MGRLIHFEIHVDDMERAKKFYENVFGWTFEDWSDYARMPYFGAVTGDAGELGINGALMQRQSPPPEPNQALNGYACTMGVGIMILLRRKFFIMVAKYHWKNMLYLEWHGRVILRIQKEMFLVFTNQMRMPNRMFLLKVLYS